MANTLDAVYDVFHKSPQQAITAITLPAGAFKQLVVRLRNPDGSIVAAFSPDHLVTTPALATAPVVSPGNVVIRLAWQVEPIGVKVQVTGASVEHHPEYVAFHVQPEHTQHVGMHYAQIGRFVGNTLLNTWPLMIMCEPSVFGERAPSDGPLTTAEVRMALLDYVSDHPHAPQLLDDVEFTDAEIAHAIKRCIDVWNESPPHVQYHTIHTFPYRHWWTVGAVALMLRAAAARYRRHALAYSAGGVSVNDTNKAQEYEQLAALRWKEFQEWMTQEKIAINRGYCWGVGL